LKRHLPVGFWERVFKDMDDKEIEPELVRRSLGLSSSTFYRKRREYLRGGVEPRRPGSGRKRVYDTSDYEAMVREVLRELPPIAGHKRIWMAMRKRGAVFGQGTAFRILKDLGLLVRKNKGRSHKHYRALTVEGPNMVWVGDTTTWWVGKNRFEIYLCVDAYSRYVPRLMVSMDRTSGSTVRYYERLFESGLPTTIHTDNGTEFTNRHALTYLDLRGVSWQHGPSHTPEAQGLVERLVKTLKEEWLMWKEPKDIIEMQSTLEDFRKWYNEVRDHSSLGYRVPMEVHYAA
jgi:putative transposase